MVMALALLAGAASRGWADSGTWTVDGNGNWNVNGNWTGTSYPDGAGQTAAITNNFSAAATITLNVPGSNNNIGRAAAPNAEFVARGRANRAWIDSSFALASRKRLAGIVIMMQADPDFEAAARGRPKAAFRALLQQLAAQVEAFPGQVVLVHGDGHVMQVDRPLLRRGGRPPPNFTRVETYGSPFMGWIKVTVDEAAPGLFRFESRPYPGERRGEP